MRKAIVMGVIIREGAQVDASAEIGDGSVIGHCVVIEPSGGKYPQTRIGKRVMIEHLTNVTAGILIEDDVFIGPGVQTLNTRHICWGRNPEHTGKRHPPIIRRGARIGGGAVILPGVEIGEEAEIGAGAVVTKDCEPYCTYLGNPAHKVRSVPPEEHLRARDAD